MPGNSAEPDRSPAAWTRECLRILKGINPAYERNREVTGRFIEFIRPDPSGLYLSHNFTRITSSYYLGFALLFTRRRTKVLFHPRVAGSRFDHGRYAASQFHDDLGLQRGQEGYPSGVWSFGPWRSNTLENLIGYGPRTNTFEVESIPLEAIVLAHRAVFLAERERLRELLAIAEAL